VSNDERGKFWKTAVVDDERLRRLYAEPPPGRCSG
jgi:hypothetical protein